MSSPAEIVMPRLSDTMQEGTILRWLKAAGEQVARGEELVEIETDKATMTYQSEQDGELEIVAETGHTLEVGAVIARMRAPSEGTAEEPASMRAPAGAGAEHPPDATHARRASAAAGDPDAVLAAKGQTTDVELSRTQQTIARRMAESRATIPDFTLQLDVDMEACVALRAQLKRLSHSQHDSDHTAGAQAARAEQPKAPTYNDMVVKACALALREHPAANGSYRDGRLQLHSRVNIGVAVAAENALVVPTLFDADEKSLGEIARETHTLAERVRSGTVTPPQLSGATFTVSNLGMYGVRSFTAIINPPQAGILSVGSVEQRAVVVGGAGARGSAGAPAKGELVARNVMTLTLACDHRILYGAEAAQFLARVRELLEAPSALTL